MPSSRPGARRLLLAALAFAAASFPQAAAANEIGHYAAGLPNVRDLVVPDEGFYAVMYNYYYPTRRINDPNGNKVRSVTLQPGAGPGLTLNLNVDIDVYAMTPMFIWSSPWKILGARYAAFLAPTLANSSISAGINSALGQGVNPDTSQFAFGDLYVQPLWLGWSLDHFDFSLGYGFYAPTGKYDVDNVTLPGVGAVRVESPKNIGLGFWTNQFQGAGYWYPWKDKRMAVMLAATYEVHANKDGLDVTPGQDFSLNYGISQYLPLDKAQQLLLEAGPSGYSTWQVTHDHGADATSPHRLDQVHAAGAQLGLTYVPWFAFATLHYDYEYYSEDRTQGQVVTFTLGKKF